MGRVPFLIFYLVGGLAALALLVIAERNAVAPTVGGAGAIPAVPAIRNLATRRKPTPPTAAAYR